MSTPSKRKIQRAGVCAFCGGPGLSKEHIWPVWASPLLPSETDAAYVRSTRRLNPYKEASFSSPAKARPGNMWTRRIRVVCRKCNSGWMSRLETEAKVVLEPLMSSAKHEVSAEDVDILKRWIALKIMIFDQSPPELSVVSALDRKIFFETHSLPPNFYIWIGQCGDGIWRCHAQKHCASMSMTKPTLVSKSEMNAVSITLGIGDLLVDVFHARNDGTTIGIPTEIEGALINLNSTTLPAVWPPSIRISEAQATLIASSMEAQVLGPNVRWLKRGSDD